MIEKIDTLYSIISLFRDNRSLRFSVRRLRLAHFLFFRRSYMKIKNKFINDHLAQLVTCAIVAFFLCFIINLPLYRSNFYTINLRWPLINAIEGGWSDNREFATNFVNFIEGTLIMMLGLVVGQRFLPENKMNFKQLLLFSFGAGLLRSLFYSFIPETYLHISRLYKLKSILVFVLFIV